MQKNAILSLMAILPIPNQPNSLLPKDEARQSARQCSLWRILRSFAFHLRIAHAPIFGRDVVHHSRHMVPTAPPRRLVAGIAVCSSAHVESEDMRFLTEYRRVVTFAQFRIAER